MMARIHDLCRRWFSDSHVNPHEPELALALRQAALLGPPIIILGIGIMLVLP